MKPKELIEEEQELHKERIDFLRNLPDDLEVGFISSGGCFLPEDTYENNMQTLRRLRNALGEVELDSYYVSASGCELALSYRTPTEFDINMFCTDLENALERVSGGKCKLNETTQTETIREVVCGTEVL